MCKYDPTAFYGNKAGDAVRDVVKNVALRQRVPPVPVVEGIVLGNRAVAQNVAETGKQRYG